MTKTTTPTQPAKAFAVPSTYAERAAWGLDAIQRSNVIAARLVIEFRAEL